MVKQKRKFNGKTYTFWSFEKSKATAQRQAKKLRQKKGTKVRIVPLTGRQMLAMGKRGKTVYWAVYKRD